MKQLTLIIIIYLVYTSDVLFIAQNLEKNHNYNEDLQVNTIIPDFIVNDDLGNVNHSSPSISVDSFGNYVITWQDKRNGNSDIYAQRYSNNGSALGYNFIVNDGQGSSEQNSPCISADDSGNFVITWNDWRIDNPGIYAQRYSNDGSKLGDNFKVSDEIAATDEWSSPSISLDDEGNFVIVWQDRRHHGDYGDIFAQRYSNDGSKLGYNFKVNDDLGSQSQVNPSISADDRGNFVVTWVDYRNEGGDIKDVDIYAQRYSNDGSKLGDNFIVSDDQRIVWSCRSGPTAPSISTDGNGNFVITWSVFDSEEDENADIIAQRYSSDGIALGNNFIVNDGQGSSEQNASSISMNDMGNFLITWYDDCNNGDIYAQRYLSNGSTIGNNFILTNLNEGEQSCPDVKLWGDRIYNTWTDTRGFTTTINVWANVLDWDTPVGIENKEYVEIPVDYKLSQNYPNPFNPNTTIKYSIPKQSKVTLKVFDLLGSEVTNLVNKEQHMGYYEIEFDGSVLTSGIYFYRLQAADFVETKKMVLIK